MIESLHSPHIARVKALLGSRGKKQRRDSSQFVAEGLQFVREASQPESLPGIDILYLTSAGRHRLEENQISIDHLQVIDVSDEVMAQMGETVTPQGILGICDMPHRDIDDLNIYPGSNFIYLNEIQDPGNAGTILRTADATGFSGVITSENSVDIYSPKVVRASAGSLWHLPVYERIDLASVIKKWPNDSIYALSAEADQSFLEITPTSPSLWIFGNEARGLRSVTDLARISTVHIPMAGNAESLNLASAAAIVLFRVTNPSS